MSTNEKSIISEDDKNKGLANDYWDINKYLLSEFDEFKKRDYSSKDMAVYINTLIIDLKKENERLKSVLKNTKTSMQEALRCQENEWGEEAMNCISSMNIDIEVIDKVLKDTKQ